VRSALEQAQTLADPSNDFTGNRELLRITGLDGSVMKGEKSGLQDPPEMYRHLPGFRWQFEDPWVQINAVVLARNAIVITRGVQKKDGSRLLDEYERWSVAALSREDGTRLWEHELLCEPMLNGLCIDRDARVIVTLRDGGVVGVGAAKGQE
jgi:hypothetical protein